MTSDNGGQSIKQHTHTFAALAYPFRGDTLEPIGQEDDGAVVLEMRFMLS